ncbi:hypothetical protein BY996DRAFT_6411648 [Phakopsora pachyrhizi]|uniref:Expressed protein n=1 Tax=Phakopsora pachyrhizi TaxID=170000 RepID=A0AAV0BRY2_PHAPC|nr:hypothetical protein BY996DRAFT_6411648 [Phakopsora pachyrhizi]CAH7690153.1 expressed protein [Phakopsora pachyrhizi]
MKFSIAIFMMTIVFTMNYIVARPVYDDLEEVTITEDPRESQSEVDKEHNQFPGQPEKSEGHNADAQVSDQAILLGYELAAVKEGNEKGLKEGPEEASTKSTEQASTEGSEQASALVFEQASTEGSENESTEVSEQATADDSKQAISEESQPSDLHNKKVNKKKPSKKVMKKVATMVLKQALQSVNKS